MCGLDTVMGDVGYGLGTVIRNVWCGVFGLMCSAERSLDGQRRSLGVALIDMTGTAGRGLVGLMSDGRT